MPKFIVKIKYTVRGSFGVRADNWEQARKKALKYLRSRRLPDDYKEEAEEVGDIVDIKAIE